MSEALKSWLLRASGSSPPASTIRILRNSAPCDCIPAHAPALDKVWIAYLISVVGLYIPVVDLMFCEIISAVLLGVILLRARGEHSDFT